MAHEVARKWFEHAHSTKKKVALEADPDQGQVAVSPSQQKLIDWAEEFEDDPESDEAVEALQNRGFSLDYPPV